MILATAGVVLALIACIVLQAFSAASEIALVSADEAKIQAETESGGRLAVVLGKVLQNRDRLLALVLTTNNLATVVAAALLTSFLHGIRPRYALWAPFILAPLTLVVGESIPKLLALRRSVAIARFAARPLSILSTIMAPVLVAETALSGLLRRIVGVPSEVESVFLSREDLQLLLERRAPRSANSPQTDAILPIERRMISRIFKFANAEARKAMVPLVQVVAIPEDTPLDAAIELVRSEGHSRIPVFRSRITDLVGVVHVFDLLEAPDLSAPVSEVMRPVSYFPESMPLDEVLLALQRTREHMSVIVDEYGGASGILTAEDLIEEIVGDIEDEYDAAERLTRIVNPRTLRVMARAPVTELNERFGIKLPEADEYATIGGLVVERLGHIPKPGEQLKAGDITVTVLRSDARAVREVMLHLAQALRPEYTRRE
jgi:CBS domain containing-hemolysin-like protein